MKYVIVAVLIILIFITLPKQTSTHTTLSSNDTILAFGDSLTYGQGANHDKSYPAILSSLTGHKVINAGNNGETSTDGLRRLPKLLKDKSIKLMILCFGGNDIVKRQSIETLKSNLKKMIHMAKAKKIDVLLISIPNLSFFGLSSLDIYKEIAEEENIPLIEDMLANIFSQPSLKSDHVHPNALGYKQIADEIYHALKENGWVE